MSSIICPECGHENQPDALYCDECGIDLPVAPPAESPLAEAVGSSFVVEEEEEVIAAPEVEEPVTEAPEIEAEAEEVIAAPEVEESVTEAPEIEAEAEEEEEEEEVIAPLEIEEPLAIVSEEESMSEAISAEPVEAEEVEAEEVEAEEVEVEEVEVEEVEAEEVEAEEVEAEPAPFIPVSSATVLDIDEPEIISVLTAPTTLAVPHAFLIHTETESRLELPPGENMVYLGKVNEEMPIQVDLSGLPDADIISRVHAVIHVEDENYYLEDAGSLNGTSLNGEAVKPGARFRKQLKTGDIITLGRHRTINLTFELEDAS